jgi:hypothetical protein
MGVFASARNPYTIELLTAGEIGIVSLIVRGTMLMPKVLRWVLGRRMYGVAISAVAGTDSAIKRRD